MRRVTVLPPEPYGSAVVEEIGATGLNVRQQVIMVEREVKKADPKVPSDRCGLLNDQFEVYSIDVTNRQALTVSVDRKAKDIVFMIHGLVPKTGKCKMSLQRVVRHRGIVQKIWET